MTPVEKDLQKLRADYWMTVAARAESELSAFKALASKRERLLTEYERSWPDIVQQRDTFERERDRAIAEVDRLRGIVDSTQVVTGA